MQLSMIEIDFEIHKLIEAERHGFDEPPYLALRRLLNLPEPKREAAPAEPQSTTGRPWREGPVELPHGTLARMEYDRGRQVYEGQFLDGELVVGGQSFPSLSAAAAALAQTRKGQNTQLNGWLYWQAKLPGESRWRKLDDLRKAARGKRL